jgi:SPP1 gp7 family putative phage head morphogenesis protein
MDSKVAQLNGRHAMHLHRYGTGTLNKILAQLQKASTRITGQMFALIEGMSERERQAFALGSFKGRRLVELKESIDELSAELKNAIKTNMAIDGKALAAYEMEYSDKLLKSFVVVPQYSTVTAAQAYAAAMAKPAIGSFFNDRLKGQTRLINIVFSADILDGFLVKETTGTLIRRIRGTKAGGFKDGILGGPVKNNISELVRTSQNHLANVAREQAMADMGVEEMQWRSTLDGRTSKLCATRDLKRYPIFEGPRPPAHRNCRSIMEPWIRGFEGRRPFVENNKPLGQINPADRIVGQTSANTAYAKWFSGTSAKFQKEWLGPTRYSLYKKGGYSISRFVDPRTGREYSIEKLRVLDSDVFKELGL